MDPTGLWNEDSVWWNPLTWLNKTTTETKKETTDIAGVSYQETRTIKTGFQGVVYYQELKQVFVNEKGEIVEVTTKIENGETKQTYTIQANGTKKTKKLDYKEASQRNLIGIEGFTSDPIFGALMLGITLEDGVIVAGGGSTLPNYPDKSAVIVDTDTFGRPYEMSYILHNNVPAMTLEKDGRIPLVDANQNEGLNKGKMYATGIRIHYGWHNRWRGSLGCQTIQPGSNKGFKKPQDKIKNYGKYMNFIDYMVPEDKRQEYRFIGYYYLERPYMNK